MSATFLERFQKVEATYNKKFADKSGLVCDTGVFEENPFIRLYRDSWITDDTGIFFSIWTSRDSAKTRQLHYNIHRLEMRVPESYAATSQAFADSFRRDFTPLSPSWPNVRVDYGPLNLMQGWIELRDQTFDFDVLDLMLRFDSIAGIVDRLLEEPTPPSQSER